MYFPNHRIEDLIKPENYSDKLELGNIKSDDALALLENMLRIRLTEQKLALEKKNGNIGGPVHLGAGQEAIAVGVSCNLKNSDKIFGAHRSHAHLLSINPNIHKLFSEILGKETGFSKGMGGSMHLWDGDSGFYGSVPIVAGTVPLAVGAGIASRLKRDKSIAVSYLGDGAAEEGVVFESMNLAKMHDSPTLFVIENNLFSSHMHLSQRQPYNSTIRIGEACGIRSVLVDGNNVLEVKEVSESLINHARNHNEPVLIEAITYRFYGHVDWREDIDVGVNRSIQDLENWKKRDPILRLSKSLIDKNYMQQQDFKEMEVKITKEIESAWSKALKDPFPTEDKLLERVYAR